MRKFLLASVATLGTGGLIGTALAQAPAAAQLAPSYNEGQVATTPTGGPSYANNNNNYQAPALPGPVANPTPGSIVIHVNGRINTNFVAGWSSLDAHVTPVPPGASAKVSPLILQSFMRLYFGADAMATNGLRYGGAIELRQNFPAASSASASSNGGMSAGAGGYTTTQTVYVRRAFSYVAGEQWGIVRAGEGDGLIGIFDNGVTTMQFLPSGVFNGGDAEAGVTNNTTVPFAFMSQSGDEYGNTKIVYMSPQIAGFDFGAQYAPNVSNGYAIGACPVAGSGCPNLSSSPVPADGARPVQQVALGARYQGKFGDVGLLAYGVWEHAGVVNYTGSAAASRAAFGAPAGSTWNGKFDPVNIGSMGAAVTFAGFTVAGNFVTGAMNGRFAARPQGGADLNGWIAGVKYVTGPLVLGAAYENISSQGSPGMTGHSQRREQAADVGAAYTVAPGLTVWTEYMYQTRHQGGFNFATLANGSAAYNDVQSQAFLLGAMLTW